MNIPLRKAVLVSLLTALCTTACSGGSATAAGTDGRASFTSGGASVEDFTALSQQTGQYNLKLLFASKGSGAYLADVAVTVQALPSQEVVMDTRTEGPLLLAALPAGRYRISAQYGDVVPGAPTQVSRTLVVPRSRMVSAVIYFSTADRVGAESPREYRTIR